MVKVVKFGGSSLCDAEHFRMAAAIIKADASRRYVVPSAPGKRFAGDTKVTDMLYEFKLFGIAQGLCIVNVSGAVSNDAGKRGAEIMGDGAQQVGSHLFLFSLH